MNAAGPAGTAAALLSMALAAAAGESFVPLAPALSAQHTPAANQLEGGLWMSSQDIEDAIKRSPRRVDDPAVETYLHDIVCRLTAEYCGNIRVYLVRVAHFNASMLPNGAMQVWTGLLLRVRDEAQLAAVLGHELGHYLRRHTLERFEDLETRTNLLTLFTLGLGGAVAAGGVNAGLADGAAAGAQLATLGSFFAFSRGQESEADRFGIQLLAQAGYDPQAASAVWQNLIDEERAGGDAESRGLFFATHPSPERRLDSLADLATALAGRQTIGEDAAHAQFFAALGPRLPDYFDDEMRLNQPGRSEHLFERLLATGFAPGLVNYYLGEVERMRDTGTLSAAALRHYEAALEHADAPPETHRAIGLWKLKAKQMDEARAQFARYLVGAPQANDREMIQYYLNLTGSTP